jgi:hypothetical protein
MNREQQQQLDRLQVFFFIRHLSRHVLNLLVVIKKKSLEFYASCMHDMLL